MSMKLWKIPGELLVFSLCWNTEDAGVNTGSSKRIDELSNKSEGNRPRAKILSSMSVWAATRRWGPKLRWAFLLQIIRLRNPVLPGGSSTHL